MPCVGRLCGAADRTLGRGRSVEVFFWSPELCRSLLEPGQRQRAGRGGREGGAQHLTAARAEYPQARSLAQTHLGWWPAFCVPPPSADPVARPIGSQSPGLAGASRPAWLEPVAQPGWSQSLGPCGWSQSPGLAGIAWSHERRAICRRRRRAWECSASRRQARRPATAGGAEEMAPRACGRAW